MTKLIITRGLMASGKTRAMKALLAELLAAGVPVVRVNRDGLRRLYHSYPIYSPQAERQITIGHHAQVEALLRAGVTVIVDDTNLPSKAVREWMELADRCGAELVIRDEFLEVPVDECIRRDSLREGFDRVGEEAIRDKYNRYLRQAKGQRLPIPTMSPAPVGVPYVLYKPPAGAPKTVMVDIDGTVALMCNRSPYDESRVHEDRPNAAVIAAVRAMWTTGHLIIFCSGRTDACQEATEKWLAKHVRVPYQALHMRAAGDGRKDSVVKREIFDRHIRDTYDVVAVFDDRAQVVQAWREIGLTVFAVAEGNF